MPNAPKILEKHIGEKFHMLTVLEVIRLKNKNNKTIAKFRCMCDCGKEHIASAGNIKGGATKSCGCLHAMGNLETLKLTKSHRNKHDYEALVGTTFLNVEVLEFIKSNKSGVKSKYKCRCHCGEIYYPLSDNFIRGKAKSCGCVKKEMFSKLGANISPEKQFSKYRWYFSHPVTKEKTYCRSSYEVLFANYLNKFAIPFEYEPKTFKLGKGIRYTPDFYLPKANLYIELKGNLGDHFQNGQMKKIKMMTEKVSILGWKDIAKYIGCDYSAGSGLLYNAKTASSVQNGEETIEDWYARNAYDYLLDRNKAA